MFFVSPAIDNDVTVDTYDNESPLSDLVHMHLEHILEHLETKGHSEKCVSVEVGILHCQQ